MGFLRWRLELNWRRPPKCDMEVSSAFRHYTEGSSALQAQILVSTTQNAPTQLSRRPKRVDAARNYDKLVAAAREAFPEADRSAALEDIARRAGVGIGTLYRHFPTRR